MRKISTAFVFWGDTGGKPLRSDRDWGGDYQQHLTTDPRAITLAAIAADTVINKFGYSWPTFGDWDENEVYLISDRSAYETVRDTGEIEDYIAYLDGEEYYDEIPEIRLSLPQN